LIFFFPYGNLKTRGIASVAELSQRAREIPGPLIFRPLGFHPDLPAGKLDSLAEEALKAFKSGHCSEI
jgi:hypothetical protein